ncbi:FAD-binding oxidoreductase [Emcibacter nanhaiensis]|uniref:FAD-binding oxidoreductase n=1 Tax=Emcibacter nanhaiensis TaxID=1505037 RepID=A0A501PAY3_9PROT|nr:FAD-binding oxidoreductase [Emcibacter nanhaiensis]TPD57513.1 FAD-binding oxidoreductase [Emcibacter nanhaiensis]
MTKPDQNHLDNLKSIAGAGGWSDDPDVLAPHLVEWRDLYQGKTPLLLLPDSSEKVAALVKYCHDNRLPLVPQGGNTGLVGGGLPDDSGNEILISLKRLNKVRLRDPLNQTITVEAGVILADLQAMAEEMDLYFPLSLASEGTCQVGGNISSNAGGVGVLKYGNMRDLVLGLEVVLPDGQLWDGLTGLRKDNTGYDLKQLFIGSEGTLGIVTAATLKLYPRPLNTQTALLAIPSPQAAIELLTLARKMSGDLVTAFEIIPRIGLDFLVRHMDATDPMETAYDWHILMECSSSLDRLHLDLENLFQQIMETAMEQELVLDGVIASSEQQRDNLWALRENLSEVQKFEGGSIKHDISVPVSKIPEFLEKATAAVEQAIPGIRPVPFGHIGDGNIHFNLTQPEGADKAAYLDRWEEVNKIVHDIVHGLDGSISAEHGIGRLKVEELTRYKSPLALDLMRKLKKTLDPANILNPGRIVQND